MGRDTRPPREEGVYTRPPRVEGVMTMYMYHTIYRLIYRTSSLASAGGRLRRSPKAGAKSYEKRALRADVQSRWPQPLLRGAKLRGAAAASGMNLRPSTRPACCR